MCSTTCLLFCFSNLTPHEVAGKRVIEIGSFDHLNGAVRPVYESWGPAQYVGTDMLSGPGVDVVVDATRLLETFGPDSFDVVVTTETFEHIRDWRAAVHHIKCVLRPGGILIMTTRSKGFAYHCFPADYWRYELSDLQDIFADFCIDNLLSDPQEPGVFIRAIKPADFAERDLSGLRLFNILTGSRTCNIEDTHLRSPRFLLLRLQLHAKTWLRRLRNSLRAKNYQKAGFTGYRPTQAQPACFDEPEHSLAARGLGNPLRANDDRS